MNRQLSWDYNSEGYIDDESIAANRSATNEGANASLLRANFDPFYNVNESNIGLTQLQVEYVLRNLEDSTELLKSYLSDFEQVHNTSSGNLENRLENRLPRIERNETTEQDVWTCRPKWISKYGIFLMLAIQLLAIIVLSILDALLSNDPSMQLTTYVLLAVVEVFSVLFLVSLLFDLCAQFYVKQLNNRVLLEGLCTTIMVFATMYLLTFKIAESSWSTTTESDNEIIFLNYIQMLHLSLSCSSYTSSDPGVYPVTWYNRLLLCLQLVLSSFHILLLVAQIFAYLTRSDREKTKQRSYFSRCGSQDSLLSRASRNSMPFLQELNAERPT